MLDYFAALRLPEELTVYARLLLSLRETDVVVTFNWDPLLLQAYCRIPPRFGKPHPAFLHGCVSIGYSGPKTDREAIALMKEAWGETSDWSMEQTAFVTLQSEDEVRQAWEPFIHTYHHEVAHGSEESWIAAHPRRTDEAYLAQYVDARFVADHPAPDGVGFGDLLTWFDRLLPAEGAAGTPD